MRKHYRTFIAHFKWHSQGTHICALRLSWSHLSMILTVESENECQATNSEESMCERVNMYGSHSMGGLVTKSLFTACACACACALVLVLVVLS